MNPRLKNSLELLKSYIAERGWQDVRIETRVNGFHLGYWVSARRMQYHRGELPDWLRQELEAIPGWSWHPREDEQRRKLEVLRQYVQRHGWDRVSRYTVVDEVDLGSWTSCQKYAYAAGKLPAWLQAELEKISGWSSWATGVMSRKEQAAVAALRQFIAKFGWVAFDSGTRVNGTQIGRFVGRWRADRRRGRLDPRLAEQLEAIPGWSWESTYPRERHLRALALLKEYVAEHSWEELAPGTRFREFNLGNWCQGRRAAYRAGKLAEWLQRELEAIPGWSWQGSPRSERRRAQRRRELRNQDGNAAGERPGSTESQGLSSL
jgi:hypothetical protein